MKINNKYNINDVVYFFHDNRIQKSKVEKIKVNISEECNTILYSLYCRENVHSGAKRIYMEDFTESLLFDSLEEIKNHLTDADNIITNIIDS